jgi:hypothetical protein
VTKNINATLTKSLIANNGAILPLFLRPMKGGELIRVGRDNDGGYLVDKRSIISTEFLLSFGIYDDWSFEKDFKSFADVPVVAFDASVGQSFFLKKLRVALSRGSRKSVYWFRTCIDYFRFFKGENKHIKKFIGNDAKDHHVSISTIAKKIVPSHIKNFFFKIDIEGSEYQVLDQLVAMSDRITGLVIEFHDVDTHIDKIESFVNKFPLSLCHMHCNNYAPLPESLTPPSIEATFTKFNLDKDYVEYLPNPKDQPNKKGEEDYSITFRDS